MTQKQSFTTKIQDIYLSGIHSHLGHHIAFSQISKMSVLSLKQLTIIFLNVQQVQVINAEWENYLRHLLIMLVLSTHFLTAVVSKVSFISLY